MAVLVSTYKRQIKVYGKENAKILMSYMDLEDFKIRLEKQKKIHNYPKWTKLGQTDPWSSALATALYSAAQLNLCFHFQWEI